MPYNPVRFTENDVRRAVRAAVKESLIVFGYEVKKDGGILVLTQPPDHPPGNPTEPAPSPESVA